MGRYLAVTLLCVSVAWGAEAPPAPSGSASRTDVLGRRVAELEQLLAKDGPGATTRTSALQADLDRLDADIAKAGPKAPADLVKRRDTLKTQLGALREKGQKQLAALEAARDELALLRLGEQVAQQSAAFDAAQRDGKLSFTPAETTALGDRLADAKHRLKLADSKLDELTAQRKALDAALAEPADKPDAKAKPAPARDAKKTADLRAKRDLLSEPLRLAALRHQVVSAQVALVEKQLAAARKLAPVAAEPKKGPVAAEDKVVRRTERADRRLTRGREALQQAQQRLDQTHAAIQQCHARGEKPSGELVRTQQKQELEVAIHESETAVAKIRKLELGAEKQRLAVAALVAEAQAALAQAKADSPGLSPAERTKRRDPLVARAAEANEQADEIEKGIAAAQKRLSLYGEESSNLHVRLREVRGRPAGPADGAYVRAMADLLDRAIEEVDEKIDKQKLYIYNLREQVYLHRQRAALYGEAQAALNPPTPGFWQRHREIVDVTLVVVGVLVGMKVLDLIFWVFSVVTCAAFGRAFRARRAQVRAYRTKVAFVRSMVKTGLGLLGVVLVLKGFGVDPAKTAGAIGLIGLLMAGMFRELVMDFVKGFDIITQHHFAVGDFIEIGDGAGHVLDFNVKYTRIRKLSGQELCVPNSKCVPSKRFARGYVDNYVDFSLGPDTDVETAGRVIDAVCADLNDQVEAVREQPEQAACFPGRPGTLPVLRYRIRVLPACPWVVAECFVPAVKDALTRAEIALGAEPRSFYMNDIETFRELFNRRLTEQQIIEKAIADAPDPGPP